MAGHCVVALLVSCCLLLPAASAPVGGDWDVHKACSYRQHNLSKPMEKWNTWPCPFTFTEVKVKEVTIYNATCAPSDNWRCRPNMLVVNDLPVATYCYEDLPEDSPGDNRLHS
ncbi:uncharacterized protein [Procambarus clarkii]|uniref:uncharacterized protein n=1 Tax=Procambarus clarkii TaxID=6728 RepID=UPI00374200D9